MNRSKSIFVAASIVLALAFTTSCSGDGGGGNEETPSSSSVGGASTPSSSGGGISSGGGTSSGGGNSSSGGSSSSGDGTSASSIPKCGAATYDPATQLCDTRDSKLYKIKKIGTQTWMAENLNHNAEGSMCGDSDSGELSAANTDDCDKYGRLYDWATAMGFEPECNEDECETQAKHRGICPSDWHIPSNDEWNVLYELDESGECEDGDGWGQCPTAGAKLKAKTGWEDCGPSGSDEPYLCEDSRGFSALPGGYGDSDGGFDDAGNYGLWWSSSESSSNSAYGRYMGYNDAYAYWGNNVKTDLYSVRCVQD